ncbi:metal ABC transporter permease [Halovulum sp. GXIMD14794]
MLDDFLVRAALAGIALALAAGPLGCLVVWRRIAYFGDATSHAAILGVALALALQIPVLAGVLAVALAVALAVSGLGGRLYAEDTLLGVAAHAGLAIGLVALALTAPASLSVESFLFGEILAVTKVELGVIWLGALGIAGLIAWRWSALLTATVSPELAQAAGIDPRREQFLVTCALAALVAVALKIVGALLITAMLVIPAAAARPLARTPEAMAMISVLLSIASVGLGLWASWQLDSPTGPTIVAAAAALFVLAQMVRPLGVAGGR